MSTNFHTAITTGAAANAATINTPLAALDAAVTAVDDRVDTIIASSGTSSTEVVDARGAGYTVLVDRLNDLERRSALRIVDPAFANNASLKRHTTITQALASASAGDTILIAPGTYTENLTLALDRVKLIGSGMPSYDSGTGRLVGGTIIRGYINCAAKKGVVIRDLGIDLYGVNSVDAITTSNTTPVSTYQLFENLAILGNGYAATAHGILNSGGAHNTFTNIWLWNWYHGIAIRGNYNALSNIHAYACTANSIIVKSATTSAHALHNTINNVVIDGNDASGFTRGGPIRLEATNASYETRYNTISNVSARNTGEGVVMMSVNGGGSVAFNTATNVTAFGGGDAGTRADFDANGATDCVFTGCVSYGRDAGYGFRTRSSAARISAIGCSSDTSGAGRYYEESGTKFDWLDTGSGQPIKQAMFEHLSMDQGTISYVLPLVSQVAGTGTITTAAAENVMTVIWTGASNGYSSVGIDLTIVIVSGGHSTTLRRTIACSRPGTSTLEAAVSTLGTDLVSAAGAQGTLTVTVDTGTANTLAVRFQAGTNDVQATYTARILTTTRNVWYIQNVAA